MKSGQDGHKAGYPVLQSWHTFSLPDAGELKGPSNGDKLSMNFIYTKVFSWKFSRTGL
jgi:hypothetical protein